MLPAGLIAVGLLISTILMWQASNAAFTATTSNGANSFATGNVVISSSPGTALFSVTGLTPGATGSACIRVSYTGTLASAIRIYGTSPSTTNSLSSYINIQIEQTTGSGTVTGPSCAGFGASTSIYNSTLSSFGSTYTDWTSGLAAWSPSGAATRDYRFTYTLSGSAPNGTMNSTAAITFNWEAQNT
jgi:hypothetical protein